MYYTDLSIITKAFLRRLRNQTIGDFAHDHPRNRSLIRIISMNIFLLKRLSPIFCLRNTLFFPAVCLIGLNIFYLFIFARQKYVNRLEWLEPGSQFEMFLPHLEGVQEIGYLTDKNFTREHNDGIYLQSQYFLAPRLVKEGDHGDRFNIIDSENIDFIRNAFFTTQSERLANNAYGQALMKRRIP